MLGYFLSGLSALLASCFVVNIEAADNDMVGIIVHKFLLRPPVDETRPVNRTTRLCVFSDILDMKPKSMEELTEVITAAKFHPSHCNVFLYSSSRGSIKMGDMRASALCDKHAKGQQ